VPCQVVVLPLLMGSRSEATYQCGAVVVSYTKSVPNMVWFCWMRFRPQPDSAGMYQRSV